MITISRLLPFVLAMLLATSLPLPISASPERGQITIGMSGPVDSFSLKAGEIVIEDYARRLAPNVAVVDAKGKPLSAFNIRKGTRVKLKVDARDRVTRITILK